MLDSRRIADPPGCDGSHRRSSPGLTHSSSTPCRLYPLALVGVDSDSGESIFSLVVASLAMHQFGAELWAVAAGKEYL